MKVIVLLLFLTSFVTLFSYSSYDWLINKGEENNPIRPIFPYTNRTCLFLVEEPSAVNQALGAYGIGVANPWNDNPSAAYTNPAIAAFHNGVSYGFSKAPWLKDYFTGMNYCTGMITYKYKDITFILPAFDMRKRFGIALDYGMQTITNEAGDDLGKFNMYENAIMVGLAYNPLESMRSHGKSSPFLDHFDLAFGLNEEYIDSRLAPAEQGQGSSMGKSSSTNIGILCKYHTVMDNLIKSEIAYGYSSFNIMNNKISYLSGGSKDIVADPTNSGIAISLSCLSEPFIPADKYRFIEDILSIRYFTAIQKMVNTTDMYSTGIELGLLDTFYWREGTWVNNDNYGGSSFGYGIKLHYKDIVTFNYNRASRDNSSINIFTFDEFNLTVDIMRIIKNKDGLQH